MTNENNVKLKEIFLFNSYTFFLSEGVKAKVYFRAAQHNYHGRNYLSVEELKMDFSVKDIKMGVQNLHNQNPVLGKSVSLSLSDYINTGKAKWAKYQN